MNSVNLIGRLTRDPEVKFTAAGVAVAHFSIAVDRAGDKGDDGYEAGFFDCEAWDKTAELIEQWFNKGKQIGVSGRLKHHRWETQSGDKRSKVEITVSQITFVGNKDDNASGERQYEDSEGQQSFTPGSSASNPDTPDVDEDVPF